MSTRHLFTALAAALALSLSGASAFAQSYTPPAGLPTAAVTGFSASPLVGQGYLPSTRMQDGSLGASRTEHHLGGYRPAR